MSNTTLTATTKRPRTMDVTTITLYEATIQVLSYRSTDSIELHHAFMTLHDHPCFMDQATLAYPNIENIPFSLPQRYSKSFREWTIDVAPVIEACKPSVGKGGLVPSLYDIVASMVLKVEVSDEFDF